MTANPNTQDAHLRCYGADIALLFSPTTAGPANSKAPPADRLPEGRDPQAEMVRGRRRRAQAGRSQNRPADGLVERSRAGHRRPPDAYGECLRLPVSQRPGEVVLRHFGTVIPGEEGSRDRGHPPARPETHGRKPGGGPGRRAVDGCKDARALRPENDVALRPCQRPGRGSRRGADREGDRGCHDGRAIARPDRSDSPGRTLPTPIVPYRGRVMNASTSCPRGTPMDGAEHALAGLFSTGPWSRRRQWYRRSPECCRATQRQSSGTASAQGRLATRDPALEPWSIPGHHSPVTKVATSDDNVGQC